MAPHSSTLAWQIPWTGGAWWAACSPWGRWGSDMTERFHFHFSLSCTGEGNSNPLQCSCLENPRDGGAWWAAVYGVAQSQTRLKRLSSSSSIHTKTILCTINTHFFNISIKVETKSLWFSDKKTKYLKRARYQTSQEKHISKAIMEQHF